MAHLVAVLRSTFWKTLPGGNAELSSTGPCSLTISGARVDEHISLCVCSHASRDECKIVDEDFDCPDSLYVLHLSGHGFGYPPATPDLITAVPFADNIVRVNILGCPSEFPHCLLLPDEEQEKAMFENLAQLPRVRRLEIERGCLFSLPDEQKLRETMPALQEVEFMHWMDSNHDAEECMDAEMTSGV